MQLESMTFDLGNTGRFACFRTRLAGLIPKMGDTVTGLPAENFTFGA